MTSPEAAGAGARGGPVIPYGAALPKLPVHLLVRDFPETLAVLRRAGIDVPRLGAAPLAAVAGAGAEALYQALAQATAWRHAAPRRLGSPAGSS